MSIGCTGLAVRGKAGTNLQPRPASLQSQRFRRGHSWYVVYRFDDRLVEVLRVIHASRDIRRILGEVE